jgi:beta-1,4-mannosyl-glycoprotein beta-1,4-N-acetylglucosaminyltransferase
LDEIPNPIVLKLLAEDKASIDFFTHSSFLGNLTEIVKFPEFIHKHHGMTLLDKTPLGLEQSLFYYLFNCRSKGSWYGSVITKAKNLSSPQQLRDRRTKYPRIKSGGWHFFLSWGS